MQQSKGVCSNIHNRCASHTDRGSGMTYSRDDGQMAGGSGVLKGGRATVKVEEGGSCETDETGAHCRHNSESSEGSDPCPICLRSCQDEAKLDSCDHHFCFEHICEWISLNPICPMCKREVHKIMHNIRDFDAHQVFDEVTVDELRRAAERKRIANESQQPMDSERRELIFMIRHLQRVIRDYDDMMSRNERTSSRMSSEWTARRQESVSRCNRYQLLLDSFDRPRAAVVADPTFRLLVYERRLLRHAIVDNTRPARRTRQRLSISPSFFIEHNAEERPRISAFIRREFAVLLQDMEHLEWVVERVYETMCKHQINSPLFTTTVCRECGVRRDYIDHFAELLFEFAVSGQQLEVFDENSEYISEDESRRRRNIASGRYDDGGAMDDILVHHVIDMDRPTYSSFTRARPPAANRRIHNPFASLNNQTGWSSHPLNSRVSLWPGRSTVTMPNDSDDSSVEILAEEPESSSISDSGTHQRVEQLRQIGPWNLPTGVNDQYRNTNILSDGTQESNGVSLSSRWWNMPFRPMDSVAVSNETSPFFMDPQRTLGEHLAMFRRVFTAFRVANALQSPLQTTPVINEMPTEQNGIVQDGGDSESGNEEIYVHQECRFPRPNSVSPEPVIEVDGDEPVDVTSTVIANALWENAGPGPSTSSQNAAASSTHPIQLPTVTGQSFLPGATVINPSPSTSGFVLIANVPVGNGSASTPRVEEVESRSRSTVAIEDDDIVEIDDSTETNNEDDEVTMVDSQSASVPIITLDDDVEEVYTSQQSPLSSSSAPPTSGVGECDRTSPGGGGENVESRRSNMGCDHSSKRRHSHSPPKHHRNDSHRVHGPISSIAELNAALDNAFQGADVVTLATSANDELIEGAEARLQQGCEIIRRVKHAMHSDAETSERNVKREESSSLKGEDTSRKASGTHADADQQGSKDSGNKSSGHGHSSKKHHTHSDHHKRSSKKRRSRHNQSSEDDWEIAEAHSKRHGIRKRRHSRTLEGGNEKKHRHLVEEKHSASDINDRHSERSTNGRNADDSNERDS